MPGSAGLAAGCGLCAAGCRVVLASVLAAVCVRPGREAGLDFAHWHPMMNLLIHLMMRIVFLLLSLCVFCGKGAAQFVPLHHSNEPLYDFLDELANLHVIELRSVAKPYSRSFVAERLQEAAEQPGALSGRQRYMLERYLVDFVLELPDTVETQEDTYPMRLSLDFLPPELSYRDPLFRFSAKPIWGVRYYHNDNGDVRHTHGGAEAHAYVGEGWSVWASLRDNYQTNEVLSQPGYLTQHEGGAWKRNVQGRVGGDYSEMRAGIAYQWRWGTIAFMKDHLQWGDNHHGASILSGRTPSYPMVLLQLEPARWLKFRYHHGWLNSQVVDSLRSVSFYDGHPLRRVHYNKYFAANLFTITPWPRLDISLGNSIVYSEDNVYPGYLIPFMFFKSVVHSQAQGAGVNHNSAMFLNVSTRQIRHLHLYGTWFIDEFSVARVGDPERLNFNSTKAGLRLSNWPLRDVAFTAEYTFTFPKTYQHRTPTTTYENNRYNLGHYMQDNATDLYLALDLWPWRGLWVSLSYADAQKGNVRPYLYGIGPQDRDPFMEEVAWRNTTVSLRSRYVLYNNISVFADVHRMHVRGYDLDDQPAQHYLDQFGPALFHGKTWTLSFGVQMGY